MWKLYLFYASMNACFQYPEIALRIWCLNVLNLQPAAYGMVLTSAGIPWACKPLLGALVDVNKKRRLGVFIAATFTIVPWIIIALGHVSGAFGAAFLLTLSSTGLCYMDITCDAILVTRVRDEEADKLGTLQSNCWLARAIGAVVAAIMGGVLATYAMRFGVENLLGFTGALGLPGAIALFYETTDVEGRKFSEICVKFKRVYRTITSTALAKPCVFIFLLCSMPNCGNTLSAFFQTALKFTSAQFAIVDVVGHCSHAVGAALYKYKLRTVPYRTVFKWGIIISIILQALQLLMITRVSANAGIPDLAFAILEAVSGSIVGQVLIMPVCVIAATRCPGGVEGTLYSAVMAITNFGSIVGMASGSALTAAMGVTTTNYDHMWSVALLCVAVSGVPLIFLSLIDVPPTTAEVEMTPLPEAALTADVGPAGGTSGGFVDEPLSDTDGAE